MGLSEIRGQDRALRTLGLAYEQGRLHHAYRFQGPEGVGKELTAMAMARVLNCQQPSTYEIPGEESRQAVTLPDFCGHCGACRKVASGNHPDVRMVTPEKGKARIAIAQIRELQGWVVYPPGEGRHKVVVVRDADRITEEAANAFLKMLEEPPPTTHFFLVTARPHNMLTTISSRSVPIRFMPLGDDDLREVLSRLLVEEEQRAQVDSIITLSEGSVTRAIMYLSEEYTEVMQTVVRLDRAYAGGIDELGNVLDDVAISRGSVALILNFLEMFYRDVAYLGVTGDPGGLMLRSVETHILERVDTLDPARASAMALLIPEHRQLLEGYVNPRMVLERLYGQLKSERV